MRRLLVALSLLALPTLAAAQVAHPDSAFLAGMRWRSIGPANMAGRVSDVEGNPLNPRVIYAAYATGGVWKTTNAGTTWANVGDNANIYSVSEIAIAPSDTSTIWVGTGEEDSRNSMSPGGGVFKSSDGGRTWRFMGLRSTNQIGRIVIHPTDPNIVYVAALGRVWGTNPERGVYKTTDGGTTWTLVKFVSPRAGAVDIAMDPRDPNHLIASFWERIRGPYFLNSGGPGSGLWQTNDAGATWTPVTNGLPTTTLGRIGLAIAPSNGTIVYAIVEADSVPNPESVRAARSRGYAPDSTKRAKLQSGMFRSSDGGTTWERMNAENDRPFYYSQLRVDPRNPDRVFWIATQARYSNDGGRTLRQIGASIHTDYHGLWIDPTNPDHFVLGMDGGLGVTWDRGRTYDAMQQMAVGQFYELSMDMQRPFWVCGGLQDNGSWCGPSESPRGRITNQDWTNIGGGDGFWTAQDPTDPDIVYSESQGGAIQRRNLRTWESRGIRPGTIPTAGGGGGFGGGGTTIARMLEDSLILARGDTTQPATPEVQRVVDSLKVRIARDTSQITRNRFNWSSPFFISSHNPRTLYMGGHRVWKTVNRGDSWVPISDDLSLRDTARIRLSLALTGGITRDATGAETHGTVVALAESPVRPGILFAGTDDGNVWMTKNDGVAWESLTGRFPGVPRGLYVSRVRASAFDTGTVYVAFDGHRSDDFHPWLYVSNDFGRTFRSLSAGLPDSEYVNVITEDRRRKELLFVGTEMGAYVSLDLGASWSRFTAGLPTVPVHDLEVHPRDRVLAAATHGRSLWLVDIAALEQATDSNLAEPAHLFAPDVALLYNARAGGGGVGAVGSKLFVANNPPFGARLQLRITEGEAPLVARGPGGPGAPGAAAAGPPGAPGAAPAVSEGQEEGAQPAGGGAGGGGPGGFGGGFAPRPPGDSVTIVITNGAGDTVRTLYTNARRAPLRQIAWDLRQNRSVLGPAALRDSIRAAVRRQFVQDSTRAAARDTSGTPGGRRGGLAGRDPTPGEPGINCQMTGNNYGILPSGGGGGGGGGGGCGGGGGGGGFGGGAGIGALVEPGVYLVTIRLNGREYKQSVRVEQPSTVQSALSGGWQ